MLVTNTSTVARPQMVPERHSGVTTSLRRIAQPAWQNISAVNRRRNRHHRVQANLWEVLTPGSLTPVVTSTIIAAATVILNLVAGIVTERKRAELSLEVERQKSFASAQQELQSLTARYRGPLLEACVDLENRLWHLANATSEWKNAEGEVNEEEVLFTLFNMAQFLGFVEIVRREGPREDAFLQAGNPQGSDTLATLVEGIRFVQAAATGNLVDWGDVEDGYRDHPGSRSRRSGEELIEWTPIKAHEIKADDLLRVSRGGQRAVGAHMIITPLGADRHYTASYSDFCVRYKGEPDFAKWLRGLHSDITELVQGEAWKGQGPFPVMRWTRTLLMQQLLIDTMDLLDPEHARVAKSRRTRLMPIEYGPLPALSEYQRKLRKLARSTTFSEYSGALRDVGIWVKSVSSMDEAQLDPLKRKGREHDAAHSNGNHRASHGNGRPPRHTAERKGLSEQARRNVSVKGRIDFDN